MRRTAYPASTHPTMRPWSHPARPGANRMLRPNAGGSPMTRLEIPRWSNSLLLVAILLLFVVEPFFRVRTLFEILVLALFIAAVWAVSQRRGLFLAGILLAVPAMLGRWAVYVTETHGIAVASAVLAILFFAFTVAALLWRALGGARVTADTIAGAVCAYLILGVMWAFVFSLIELTHPGSFLINGARLDHVHPGPPSVLRQELLYLSLVTLSTVGYGDIVPAASPARMLAVLEAVMGQLYLAVLIGRLVGLHMAQP